MEIMMKKIVCESISRNYYDFSKELDDCGVCSNLKMQSLALFAEYWIWRLKLMNDVANP